MDRESLVFLLSGGHLSMPERIARGLWPHPALEFTEIVAVSAECLRANEWFPRQWQPTHEGALVHEGGTIQRVRADHFVYRNCRSGAINPHRVAQQVETTFSSAEAAARHYLRWDLQLPGHLDGWEVSDG